MSRRKNNTSHTADSPVWSATRTAQDLVELRDLTVDRTLASPYVQEQTAVDLKNGLNQYAAVFAQQGSVDPMAEALIATGRSDMVGKPINDLVLNQRAKEELDISMASLRGSQGYIISPTMYATTVAAAKTITDEESSQFAWDDLPGPDGLLLLPQHMIFQPGDDTVPQDLLAFSWNTTEVPTPGASSPDATRPALMIKAWLDVNGPIQVEGFVRAAKMAKDSGFPMPPLMELQRTGLVIDALADGHTITDADRELMNVSLADKRGELFGGEDDLIDRTGDYDGHASIEGENLKMWVQKFMLAFMRLANQRVATVSEFREGIHPAMKPRPHHDTRVVQLRSYSTGKTGNGGQSGRVYKNRFLVSLHKRNQWYPSTKSHKLIWIGPYIKGPENAPLLAGEKINALVR